METAGLFIDSSNNITTRIPTALTIYGRPVFEHRIHDRDGVGYLAEADGGVMGWYGEGERYATVEELAAAACD